MSETATNETPTPGPWEAGIHPANPAMNIVRPIMFGRRMGKLPECEGGHSFIRNRADALLIAAAPDLLEACQGLVRLVEAFSYTTTLGSTQRERLAKAKAVIAAATTQEHP